MAVQKAVNVNIKTRFLNGKMLMFSKISLKSFVCDLIDVFMFQNKDKKNYMTSIKILSISKFNRYR